MRMGNKLRKQELRRNMELLVRAWRGTAALLGSEQAGHVGLALTVAAQQGVDTEGGGLLHHGLTAV